jgi:hypothetical protein
MSNNRPELLDTLRQRLTDKLNDPDEGFVICKVEPGLPDETSSLEAQFETLVRDYEGVIPPSSLVEMSREIAIEVAAELFRGLLFARPRDKPDPARRDAELFLSLFDSDAQFYSPCQYKLSDGFLSSVGPLLITASMGGGFFVKDAKHIGCLLVGDED